MTTERGSRRTKQGVVVSNKMDKTVVVRVERTLRHPRYQKVVTRAKRYYAHTDGEHQIGDKVAIVETRPLSKLKRWRVASSTLSRSTSVVSRKFVSLGREDFL